MRLVLMLTTAGEAFFAATLKLPGATPPAPTEPPELGPDSVNVIAPQPLSAELLEMPFNHSGFKVTSTNQIATKTVTTCENNCQVLFIGLGSALAPRGTLSVWRLSVLNENHCSPNAQLIK